MRSREPITMPSRLFRLWAIPWATAPIVAARRDSSRRRWSSRFSWFTAAKRSCVWTRATVSSKSIGFVMKSTAPTPRPASLLSFVVRAVTKMTGIERVSLLAWRRWQTSIPSMSGIMRSRRMRSGFLTFTCSSASRPLLAVVTCSPTRSSLRLRSWTLIGWSSTTRMVALDMAGRRFGKQDGARWPGRKPRRSLSGGLPQAEGFDSVPHKHGHRHRADAAGHRRDLRGQGRHRLEMDVADKPVSGLLRGIGHPVHTDVDHDHPGLDHGGRDKLGPAVRRDQDVGLARDRRQVDRAGVADGDGRVRPRLLAEREEGGWLADDQRAAA